MFSGEMDSHSAFRHIQAGAGGTEATGPGPKSCCACTCAGRSRGWKPNCSKSPAAKWRASSRDVPLEGDYAYGCGRPKPACIPVRSAAFDSDNRGIRRSRRCSSRRKSMTRSTSTSTRRTCGPTCIAPRAPAASTQQDRFRVRITQCPPTSWWRARTNAANANRDRAMKMLAAKLYELEVQERTPVRDAVEATKSDIGCGSQIRTTCLTEPHQGPAHGIERSDTQKVLDATSTIHRGEPEVGLSGVETQRRRLSAVIPAKAGSSH